MKTPPLGKWRQRLWPVHSFELRKFLPLLFMKFFISFNFSILLSLKDTFVVTEKGSGAEVIPILKGWIVLPFALLATAFYSKLSNLFRRSTLFYGILSFFLLFFVVYAFFLYPNKELLSPHASSDWLISKVGFKYQNWVAIYRNWMQALFFVTSELWGGIVFFLLFWGFVNQISSVGEAKRYYTLFIAAGDTAAILTGPLVAFFAQKYGPSNFCYALQWQTSFLVGFGIIIMALHYWLTRKVLIDPQQLPLENSSEIEKKTTLSLVQALKKIFSSKPLRCLAVMVIGYGFAISLIEISWKANLRLAYPNPHEYQAFFGKLISLIGIASLVVAFFFSGNFIRVLGWHFSAQITPVLVGGTGVLFLLLLLFQDKLGFFSHYLGITPLFLLVFFGAFQNVISKVVKYCFFDPTKEMAFIPLDLESKVKGKAAVDIVGSRLGKAGSSWIQVALITLSSTGSVLSITSLLMPFIAVTVAFWIYSVKTLNKQFLQTPAEEGSIEEELETN